jgi:hypothetical protein
MGSKHRRPAGRLFCFAAILLAAAAGVRAADTPPTTTLIQDIVYRANGTPATGTLVISWPAFETLDHKTVAAGVLSVKLGEGGSLSVSLAPNRGATPLGTYYKVVTKLDDGTTTTEYWNVPDVSPATVASVRTSLLAGPAQAPTQNYVQQAEVSTTPLPNKIVRATNSGQIDSGWLPASVATHDSVVHLTQDETIAGSKTFSNVLRFGGSLEAGGLIQAPYGIAYEFSPVIHNAASWTPMLGIFPTFEVTANDYLTRMLGMENLVRTTGTTDFPLLLSYTAQGQHDGTGRIQDVVGYWFDAPYMQGGGAITNTKGFVVDNAVGTWSGNHADQTFGFFDDGGYTNPNHFSFYSMAAQSYFGGPLINPLLGAGRYQNLLRHSQLFGGAGWTALNGASVADNYGGLPYGGAPDGTVTAALLTNGGVAGSGIAQTFTTNSAAGDYVFSIWAYPLTSQTITIEIYDQTAGQGVSKTFHSLLSSGFTRYSVQWVDAPAGHTMRAAVYPDGIASSSGKALAVWGAQVAQTREATAYIPTGDTPAVAMQNGVSVNGNLSVAKTFSTAGSAGIGKTPSLAALDVAGGAAFTAPVTFTAGSGIVNTVGGGNTVLQVGGSSVFYADGSNGDVVVNTGHQLRIPQIKSTTGTRYVCVDTNGYVVSSATPCVGT